MISTDALTAQGRRVLDAYGKNHSGSELADFVARRTRLYLLQEIERAILASRISSPEDAADIVRSFKDL